MTIAGATGLEFFVYGMVVIYVLNEYRHFEHEGWSRYLKFDWVLLDVVNYVLFILGLSLCRLRLSALFSRGFRGPHTMFKIACSHPLQPHPNPKLGYSRLVSMFVYPSLSPGMSLSV